MLQAAFRPNLVFLIRVVLGLSISAFLIKQVAENWRALSGIGPLSWPWLALATVLGTAGLLGFSLSYRAIVQINYGSISLLKAIGLLYVPMLWKYVPGKVWVVVGGLWLHTRAKIPKPAALACIAESMFVGLVGAAIVTVALGAWGFFPVLGRPSWVLLGAALAICMNYKILIHCFNFAMQLMNRRDWFASPPTYTALLTLLGLNAISWLVYGVGFFCVARSIENVPLESAPQFVALFATAQVAGLLVVVAPAGLGVREGVLFAGLSPLTGPGGAIAIAASCRIWQTVLELMLAAIGWWALRPAQSMKAHSKDSVRDQETSGAQPLIPGDGQRADGHSFSNRVGKDDRAFTDLRITS